MVQNYASYWAYIFSTFWVRNKAKTDRDDRLACFGYSSRPQADRRKDFVIKEDFNLSTTCKTNLKAVNFLDATLNLTTGKYQPYNKPNNNPLYQHSF